MRLRLSVLSDGKKKNEVRGSEMKLTDRPGWKKGLLVLTGLMVILLAVGVTFAAYTSQDAQRAVVRNQSSERVRFASNYLQTCLNGTGADHYAGKTVLFSADEKAGDQLVTVKIEVYNYMSGNTGLVSERDISYNMTIKLSGGGGQKYSVSKDGTDLGEGTQSGSGENAAVTWTASATLTGRIPKSNTYIVTFPGSDIDKVKITATAIPENFSVTNNQMLAAVIAPCTEAKTNIFTYRGNFTDSTTGNPKEYAGFNYEVSISSGKADVELGWNPAIVEIDPFFVTKLGSDIKYEKEKGTLNFVMDQTAGTGDYLIPFYIVEKSKIPDNWDAMKKIIWVEAVQQTASK